SDAVDDRPVDQIGAPREAIGTRGLVPKYTGVTKRNNIENMSFRNYTPVNETLKDQESKITTPADIGDTVEKKMEGVVEKVIQEEDEKRAKDVDIFTLAPKKPNWDLKRDIEPQLLKLEKKTRAAVIELIRKERPQDLSMA
ncbi:hypothetical protein BGZ91_004313, partial [Linnemannia elongata]